MTADLFDRANDAGNTIANLVEELRDSAKTRQELAKDNMDLINQVAELEAKLTQRQLDAWVAATEESRIKALEEELGQARGKLTYLEAENGRLNDRLLIRANQTDSFKREVLDWQQEVGRLNSRVAEADTAFNVLQAENTELKEQIAQAPYRWALRALDQLREQLREVESELKATREQNRTYADEITELTAKLESERRLTSEYGDVIDNLKAENDDLKRANESLMALKNRPRPETVRRGLVVMWRENVRNKANDAFNAEDFPTYAAYQPVNAVLNKILQGEEPRYPSL